MRQSLPSFRGSRATVALLALIVVLLACAQTVTVKPNSTPPTLRWRVVNTDTKELHEFIGSATVPAAQGAHFFVTFFVDDAGGAKSIELGSSTSWQCRQGTTAQNNGPSLSTTDTHTQTPVNGKAESSIFLTRQVTTGPLTCPSGYTFTGGTISLSGKGANFGGESASATLIFTIGYVAEKPAPWVILLCKYKDQPQTEPYPLSYYQNLFTEAGEGQGGMFDYWAEISYGHINLSGSIVKGWYTMPIASTDLDQTNTRSFRVKTCAQTADADVDYTKFAGILAIFNACCEAGAVAVGGVAETFDGKSKSHGEVALDPGASYAAFASHEMGHGLGLPHSFLAPPDTHQSDDHAFGGSDTQEYSNCWDIMSFNKCPLHSGLWSFQGAFGQSGPGLNGEYLAHVGWLTSSEPFLQQVVTYSAGPAACPTAQTVTISALNAFSTGPMLIKIPISKGEHYTVEFRQKSGWDKGIPRTAVLINEVRTDGLAYLVNAKDGSDWVANQEFTDSANHVSVRISAIHDAQKTADISLGALNCA